MIHKGKVQTVLGPVEPTELGLTLPHEHVLIDMTLGACSADVLIDQTESGRAAATTAEAGWEPGEDGPGTAASYRARWNEPICLENRADVARNWFYYGNYKSTSIEDAIYEANLFKRHGGGCLVDQTSIGLARDPRGLQQVARATGVHIVMATSYYTFEYHPAEIEELDIGGVQDRIMRDIEVGVGGAGVQAGIIGEVGMSTNMHPREEKVLRASARAQKASGLPLSIHPGFGPDAIWAAVRILEEEQADLSRTIMCHVDHRLASKPAPHSFEPEPWLELAKTGMYLEFDCFGWEESYRQRGQVDMPNDAIRLNEIMALVEAGHSDRVLMSHDLALQHWQRKYGGHGWQHIPETVTALMRYKGFDENLIRKILVDNPGELLTIA
jgi:phosphotriesterase-related protein